MVYDILYIPEKVPEHIQTKNFLIWPYYLYEKRIFDNFNILRIETLLIKSPYVGMSHSSMMTHTHFSISATSSAVVVLCSKFNDFNAVMSHDCI